MTHGQGACECTCGQVAVRVRVRVHMQESARTRTCCRRCVRVFVLCKCACLCGGKACGHVHARAEQRQVLIPHGVERHHAARGRVGERKRVGGGWLVLFELPAMLVTCLEIWGPHDVYVFKKLCRIMELFRNFFCGQKLA